MSHDDVLTPKQVCEQYGIFGSPAALADRRWRGTGPAYIKTSTARCGRVFYRRSSIEKWLDSQTIAA
ncbi:helix-turn-helix domain-containing protein [Kitasatospora sp. NBC_00240]|uniref:helix-turn-helix transcriptional regulator n=1 Tax=Kitasatospora sp. NBC_00240 TaxID=2903567 RepID=UPI0022537039|nr:helix-turn-helix domain-containing protein [Kitasatospora sp. NBC_00240]MCX5211479.1 helix-turn-helix domain-containing protein [Kitasatospora sp. NBC_00240]